MQFIAQAAHPAPFGRDERAPQPGGPGPGLQLCHDVEVRPGADLRLGGQHLLVDEGGDPRAGFLDVVGNREVDHARSPQLVWR
jgi:hypothetical protein